MNSKDYFRVRVETVMKKLGLLAEPAEDCNTEVDLLREQLEPDVAAENECQRLSASSPSQIPSISSIPILKPLLADNLLVVEAEAAEVAEYSTATRELAMTKWSIPTPYLSRPLLGLGIGVPQSINLSGRRITDGDCGLLASLLIPGEGGGGVLCLYYVVGECCTYFPGPAQHSSSTNRLTCNPSVRCLCLLTPVDNSLPLQTCLSVCLCAGCCQRDERRPAHAWPMETTSSPGKGTAGGGTMG